MSTGDMVLNIGPQHPSTHGVLRVVTRLDGERVVDAEPVLGYMHRAFEKLAEQRSPMQNTALFNRLDWISGFCNEVPYCIACEQLAGIEVPKRAQVQRVILFELTRLASHSLFCGVYGLELGALTAPMYGYRDREYALDLLEMVTGQRMHTNWARIGGVKEDFPEGFYERVPPILEYYRTRVEQWLEFLIDNDVFIERTRGIGELPPDVALDYGVSGPNLRASGVPFGRRARKRTYLGYGDYEFEVPVGEHGDCFDRYVQRVREMWESCNIVEQALDDLPPGPVNTGVGRTFKVPRARSTSEPTVHAASTATTSSRTASEEPYRLKIRTALVLQRQRAAVPAEGHLRSGHRRDPRQPRLRGRGHRPMTGVLEQPLSDLAASRGGHLPRRRLLSTGLLLYGLLKIHSRIMNRVGPMYAGRFHGVGQPIAEFLKPIQKEDIVPDRGRRAGVPARADRRAAARVPRASRSSRSRPGVVAADIELGLFFVLAISARRHDRRRDGRLRVAEQVHARRRSCAPSARSSRTSSRSSSVPCPSRCSPAASTSPRSSRRRTIPFVIWPFPFGAIAFVIFLLASFAEVMWNPFDMPVAESEIVTGPYTEYSGMRFIFFYMSEFAHVVVYCGARDVAVLRRVEAARSSPPLVWFVVKVSGVRRSSSSGSASRCRGSARTSCRSSRGSSSSRSDS